MSLVYVKDKGRKIKICFSVYCQKQLYYFKVSLSAYTRNPIMQRLLWPVIIILRCVFLRLSQQFLENIFTPTMQRLITVDIRMFR